MVDCSTLLPWNCGVQVRDDSAECVTTVTGYFKVVPGKCCTVLSLMHNPRTWCRKHTQRQDQTLPACCGSFTQILHIYLSFELLKKCTDRQFFIFFLERCFGERANSFVFFFFWITNLSSKLHLYKTHFPWQIYFIIIIVQDQFN